MNHIFISYSHDDGIYAKKLAAALEDEGFSVWIDDHIESGDRWFKGITEAIRACGTFVVIMTPKAESSEWVEREVLLALREGKPIIPLLLDGQEFPILITKQFVDVRSGDMPGDNFYSRIVVAPSESSDAESEDAEPADEESASDGFPMLDWRAIPAGTAMIEETRFQIGAFNMSKYPVTNAQFQAFIDDGYRQPEWWDYSPLAKDWHRANPKPQTSHFPGDMHPREGVNWYEAVAFCQWLGAQLDLPLRLPTEAEWQFAAQGEDELAYPWGNTFDAAKCNTSESAIDQTTPVDRYPEGASPFGVMDMSGNVLEWCLSTYVDPARTSLSGDRSRTLRGGSWNGNFGNAITTARFRTKPERRTNFRGFRICYAS